MTRDKPLSLSVSRRPRRVLGSVLALWAAGWLAQPAGAHQVPNLTIEAEFSAAGEALFQVNLDPRLFLAEDPTTLPPVAAPWYRDQTDEEKAETLRKALDYLRAAVTLFFDDQPFAEPSWEFQPIDGATGQPFGDATTEVHLVARVRTRCPDGGETCSIRLETPAKAPAVLLNSLDHQAERRPQILFPGESSRPFRFAPAPP